ncbi:hypothetical protein [Streptomyces sp. DSM 40750]|uniref:hypothetical protein n=1 Tax=Streptomyces sp. DSM 40750 TaxID=2801030 RepID=UPI00214B431C|nr:hypothetical protein [Streptomyces sp. DSM 40750]UUU19703.1 hypothetical protein JIX55_04925 [Streptomyces sp. DSM 40750]
MHATLPLPTSDVDLFADDVLHDPYPELRELREAGPAVRLTAYDAWVLPRDDHVRAALADHESFSSAHGVGYEDQFNAQTVTTNAVEQGRAAAAGLLQGASARPYRPDPYFWTEQSGLDIKISGELPLTGTPDILAGSVNDRSALLRWRHDADTATAVAVNHRLPVIKLKRLGAGVPAPAPART